ncbi:replication-relaxation family protein [Kitasatospora sp. NPDC088351]|uniref:replication-relaxation family protein n=1 Tax=Kitasatospora sp. NPDC088351 TaxID=3155180 RepID=UPI003427A085
MPAATRAAGADFEEPVMAMPPEIDHAVVAALSQFRMATAEQLRVLHTPEAGPEQMRRRLRRLKDEGLVEDVVLPQAGRPRAWFPTGHAARIAATFPELEGVASPPPPGDKSAARLRLGHTLAVVRTHVAFVAGARAAEDECAPLDFLPEVYHRYGEGPAGAVIPDGLLHYGRTAADGRTPHRAFVEVDRGTMASEKPASKLIGYARFHDHHPIPAHLRRTSHAQGVLPARQQHYVVFLRLLFVLTGTGQAGFANRANDLEIATRTPYVARMLRTVAAGVAELEDLEADGAGADLWWSIADLDDGPAPWWELTGTRP